MKILIVCVNYNSYPELKNYLASIETSVVACSLPCQVDVWVADNSSEKEVVDVAQYKHITVQVKPLDNLGYLGGAAAIINNLSNLSDYDFVIISNVDLVVKASFFYQLLYNDTGTTLQDVVWIAPKLYSIVEKRDKNPRLLKRYSKKRLLLLLLMYHFPLLHFIYTSTLYKRKSYSGDVNARYIYAGHGSMMIFTNKFFQYYPKLEYPAFLYGEEIYLAELVRKIGMHVYYNPRIEVKDIEHVSTAKMKSSFFYQCNKEALKYIISAFYS